MLLLFAFQFGYPLATALTEVSGRTWVKHLRSSLHQMSRPLAGAVAEIIEGRLGSNAGRASKGELADGRWAIEPFLYGNTHHVPSETREAAHMLAEAWMEGIRAGRPPLPDSPLGRHIRRVEMTENEEENERGETESVSVVCCAVCGELLTCVRCNRETLQANASTQTGATGESPAAMARGGDNGTGTN